MPSKIRIFSDVTSVSRSAMINLEMAGLVNKSGVVVAYCTMAKMIRDRMVKEQEAKQMILLELESEEPRHDLIKRLVGYLTKIDKESTLDKINKHLSK